MSLTKTELRDLYRKRAPNYDVSANLYYLIGFRETAYRKRAVAALELEPGDTVVEIACGTGLNFPLLHKAVGPEGRIIGVDLTDGMLRQAAERVEREGWSNVELVRSDAADFAFPPRIDGVLSSFAITLVPEFDRVIERGIDALASEGRFVILDFKRPDWAPRWLLEAFVRITAPFGVTLDLAERHPWESLDRHGAHTELEEVYFGFAYVAAGEKAGASGKAPAPGNG